ncbi:ester cyclase [Pseudoduganella sp. FT25W]|uniref:Ester cyclase n=1 Tax=Duganella alba TaxID=2666081 RepID=A0A6L5QPG6_9BURK|nr:ester cyclase [Duganella alba]MRX11152.1 ester cyclase [Duganella alba]MRX19281.1 ester cyclase [Duganella alba]
MKALLIASLLAAGAAHADPVADAARIYAAFWNTGDPALAKKALAPDFIDRTLPAGREQGVNGPLQASLFFRTAVPDLQAEATHIVPNGELVSVRLHFTGHFTGKFGAVQGRGQAIDFQAFDLYRVVNGRIAENWHLEDNLTLLQQMGITPDPQSAASGTQ